MLQVELVPDLSHCIETVAKREWEESLKQLLASGELNEELEERLELLRMFRETMDFRMLRAESEKHLLEGKRVRFVVYLEGEGPKYDLQVSYARSVPDQEVHLSQERRWESGHLAARA